MQCEIIDRVDIFYIVIPVRQWYGPVGWRGAWYSNGDVMRRDMWQRYSLALPGNGIVQPSYGLVSWSRAWYGDGIVGLCLVQLWCCVVKRGKVELWFSLVKSSTVRQWYSALMSCGVQHW